MKIHLPVLLFAVLSLFLAGCGNTQIKLQDTKAEKPSTIKVQGIGEVTAVPDQAKLTVTLLAQAETSEAASGEVNANAAAMIEALKAAGVEKKHIQTGYVSVQPEYEQRQAVVVHSLADKPKPRAIVAYNARYNLGVTISPLDKVGDISEAIRKQKGFSSLAGPNLSISNPGQYQLEAIEKAYANALEQAERLAEKAGLEIKVAKSINVNSGGFSPRPMMRTVNMAAKAEAAPMPLEAGEQKLSASLQVVFECRPAKKK